LIARRLTDQSRALQQVKVIEKTKLIRIKIVTMRMQHRTNKLDRDLRVLSDVRPRCRVLDMTAYGCAAIQI
jgi:hypothetical protein